jgi:hypothetical protein
MEKILSGVQVSMYMVVPSRYTTSIVLNTDGTLIDGRAGFVIHWTEEGSFGYKISSPTGIFTAKVTEAIYVILFIKTTLNKKSAIHFI